MSVYWGLKPIAPCDGANDDDDDQNHQKACFIRVDFDTGNGMMVVCVRTEGLIT